MKRSAHTNVVIDNIYRAFVTFYIDIAVSFYENIAKIYHSGYGSIHLFVRLHLWRSPRVAAVRNAGSP